MKMQYDKISQSNVDFIFFFLSNTSNVMNMEKKTEKVKKCHSSHDKMNSREFLFPSVCQKKGFSSFNFALIKKSKIPQRKSPAAKAFDTNGVLFHLFRFSVAPV